MDINTLTAVLVSCLVFNYMLLWLQSTMFWYARDWLTNRASKRYGIDPEKIKLIIFGYLMLYKLLIIVFNAAPMVAIIIVRAIAAAHAG